ncbi:MAG: hypothetical protein K2J35_02895, partial [Eubacterium sp.]|nr:hypothetical protein [Eubacterium sp.]
HMYCHVNPVQMYDDYGIAAFDLAAGSQAIPFSYYYLEEALKTQKPSLVILDVYMMIVDDSQEKEEAQANFVSMKPSYTKYRALRSIDGLENLWDIFWEFPIMHTRYGSINEASFDLDEGSSRVYLGYTYRTEIVPYDSNAVADISDVTGIDYVSKRKEEYLRKCIELCKKNNVDIVLTNSPWPEITEEYQRVYNFVQQIADEYEVKFLNGCLYVDDMGLDYTTDYMGGRHLNYTGAYKYTKWLTEYLISEGYSLPDRRGDDRYSYWDTESMRLRYVVAEDAQYSKMNFYELMDTLRNDDNFYYILTYNGNSDTLLPEYDEYLRNCGIALETPGVFVFKRGELVWQSYFNGEDDYADYIQRNWIKVTGDENQLVISMCGNDVGIVDQTKDIAIKIYIYNEFIRAYCAGCEYEQINY